IPDGSPWVTNYAFHYKLQTSSTWIQNPSATNTYHLTGLTPATTYDCRVYYYKGPVWGSVVGTFTTGAAKEVNVDNANNGVNIYPNPFVNKVNLDLFTQEGTNVSWKIYDMTGKVMLSGSESVTSGYSTLDIDASNLPKGVYMLNAIMNDQMQSFRIMKQ
ncbi:MAG: T9SS type A sorting domain-containing protein, partial [Bacteroidota bacterium]